MALVVVVVVVFMIVMLVVVMVVVRPVWKWRLRWPGIRCIRGV